ncbi:MAG: hypothetical protein LRY71_00385 [Bacillaceae bacterium]|nr:hypothetical protein [Bacillaceae bacterium]
MSKLRSIAYCEVLRRVTAGAKLYRATSNRRSNYPMCGSLRICSDEDELSQSFLVDKYP